MRDLEQEKRFRVWEARLLLKWTLDERRRYIQMVEDTEGAGRRKKLETELLVQFEKNKKGL